MYRIRNSMSRKPILFLFLWVLFFSSCEVINPDEGVPSYIQLDEVGFKVESGQGTDSVEIKDAWVYIDSELIGAFQLPARVPILKQDNQNVEIRFGVLLNGIDATRTINPFYLYDSQNVKLIPGDEVKMKLNSSYNSLTQFVWNSIGQEGFEEGGISIDSVAGSSTKIEKSSQEVFEGSFSGHIYLDAGHKTYIGQSSNKFVLPKQNQAVVMEIHCKNTSNHFAIGMFVEAVDGQVTIVNHLIVNPGPDWKKLYVNFTELVSYYPQAKNYRVFFTAELEDVNLDTDIYLDNIKLMHF